MICSKGKFNIRITKTNSEYLTKQSELELGLRFFF